MPSLVKAMKQMPDEVNLQHCTTFTWRGAREIFQQLQSLYQEGGFDSQDAKKSPSKRVELYGTRLHGCRPEDFESFTSLPAVRPFFTNGIVIYPNNTPDGPLEAHFRKPCLQCLEKGEFCYQEDSIGDCLGCGALGCSNSGGCIYGTCKCWYLECPDCGPVTTSD